MFCEAGLGEEGVLNGRFCVLRISDLGPSLILCKILIMSFSIIFIYIYQNLSEFCFISSMFILEQIKGNTFALYPIDINLNKTILKFR